MSTEQKVLSGKVHVGITLDPDVYQDIENLRGLIKRATLMNRLLRLGLKVYKKEKEAKV